MSRKKKRLIDFGSVASAEYETEVETEGVDKTRNNTDDDSKNKVNTSIDNSTKNNTEVSSNKSTDSTTKNNIENNTEIESEDSVDYVEDIKINTNYKVSTKDNNKDNSNDNVEVDNNGSIEDSVKNSVGIRITDDTELDTNMEFIVRDEVEGADEFSDDNVVQENGIDSVLRTVTEKPKKAKKVQVSLYLDEDVKKDFEKFGKKFGKGARSELVNNFLREVLNKGK